MNSAHDLVARPAGSAPSPSHHPLPPLASWYTPGMTDGLGDRLLMFDNTAAASLELLRFRPELASAAGFERALRDRVAELADFEHPSFSRIRTVQHLDGDEGLTLVSVHTPGKRLSELFHGFGGRGAVHPEFAAWLIRELTPALADLHEYADGVAHGALGPDRIVLTPEGRLVIVEHVLGSALERLRLPPERLWHELGIAGVPANGVTRLNGRSDIVQLGLVALSFALGRRVTPDEYPHNVKLLLDEFSEAAARRSSRIGSQLRPWLERALDGRFGSSEALHAALRDLPEPVHRHSLDEPQSPAARAIAQLSEAPMNHTAIESSGESAVAEPAASESTSASGAVVLDYPTPDGWKHEKVERAEDALAALTGRRADQRRSLLLKLAVAFAAIALVEAAVIGRLLTRPTGPAAMTPIPLAIESLSEGETVLVDGHEAGITPLVLRLGGPFHSIRVLGNRAVVASPPGVAVATKGDPRPAGARGNPEADSSRALATAAARQRSGGVRLSSPFELHVFEGERILGSSADGPIVANAGVHHLDFVNNALEYRSRQTVEIKAGQIVSLKVQPPDGRVSINASPWAQVWIDGNLIGETPLANVSVPLGEHEITFRHPQLGERRVTTLVKAGAPTRVSATLAQ